ncbi:hypothetical protein L829_3857 [Mycobacteroides abscessus MAB_030201_1075]|uniref:Uncharacterized protein n=1 Tax=Mycobacteroides abscessus MAB_030201_1075 TaxID=1335410 RepID=A0A829PSU9_9MYCO|nr:hypothetical protein L829_3857 [Mycobacteroides abscessus MAB_030201_1075]
MELPVGVHHVDPDATAAHTCDEGAQGGGGAPAPTDHLSEIVGVDVNLHGAAATVRHQVNADIIGVVDDSSHQVLDGIDHNRTHLRSYSLAASADSAAGSSAGASASAASAFSSFLGPSSFSAGWPRRWGRRRPRPGRR